MGQMNVCTHVPTTEPEAEAALAAHHGPWGGRRSSPTSAVVQRLPHQSLCSTVFEGNTDAEGGKQTGTLDTDVQASENKQC